MITPKEQTPILLTVKLTVGLLEHLAEQDDWSSITTCGDLAQGYVILFEQVVWHAIREGYTRPRYTAVLVPWISKMEKGIRLPPYIPNEVVVELNISGLDLMITPRGELRLAQLHKEILAGGLAK